jgi:hypothetical protein
VHFVTISTEIYFGHPELLPRMWNWLDADLKAAQANRSAAPWIVVNGHRPLYCSCDGDCDGAVTDLRGDSNRAAPFAPAAGVGGCA